MTESAAILIWLADLHPESGLSPRCRIKPDVRRIGVPPAQRDAVVETVHPRIAACRAHMDGQLASPSPHLLGERLTVLDLYVGWSRASAPGATASTRSHRA